MELTVTELKKTMILIEKMVHFVALKPIDCRKE